MDQEKSVAHRHSMNHFGADKYPDGLIPWRDAEAPDIDGGKTTGRLRGCGYCGSMHPADVATAIRAGAKGNFADWKYGWPHKAYFDKIPNPHAGMLEARSSYGGNPEELENGAARFPLKVPAGFDSRTGEPKFHYYAPAEPAAPTTYGKFYSVHLQDATPEDRAVIEHHLGLAFDFTPDGKVGWKPA
jgi:hypothetical protein